MTMFTETKGVFGKIIHKFNNLDDNKKKIFTNVFWAMLGKVVNMIGALFVGILVARYLGPEQYGIMNYVISYVTLFTVLSTFGLSNIEVRELAKTPESRDLIMGTCFRIRLFFSTVAYVCIIISLILFNTDWETTIMILMYGLILYSGCFEVIRNYFTSIVQNEYVVKSEIARTVIGAAIKIVLLFLHCPLIFFVGAAIFDTVLVASGYCISYQSIVGKIRTWGYDKNLVPCLIKDSFPLVLSGAAIIVYQRIDQVMIGNMIDKESVGYFATASKFLDIILYIPVVLTQTMTPLLVQLYRRDEEGYAVKSQQFMNIVVWVSILIALFVSLISYWLIKYTYGIQYMAAVPILQIMAWKTVGMSLSSTGGQLIILENKQKWAVIRNLCGCVVCVVLNLVFIPLYGIIGSAIVTIITVFVSGYLANILIPPYRDFFAMESKALLLGWKDLKYLKESININN